MIDYIDAWNEADRQKIEIAYHTRQTDDLYPDAVIVAAQRGYKPAPLNSLLNFANSSDLYSWRGRLWIKALDLEPSA